jgi:hypothetical protein
MKTGQIDSAIASLKEVLKLYPYYGFAKLYLLEAYINKKDKRAAAAVADELDELWSAADTTYYYL